MKPEGRLDGRYVGPELTAEVSNVPVFILKEDKNYIFYSPVFDISGYGQTKKEAAESLTVAINEFFRYTTNKKTYETELLKLGWKQESKKKFSPPSMSDLVKERDYLTEIMDSHDFQKSSFPVEVPVMA